MINQEDHCRIRIVYLVLLLCFFVPPRFRHFHIGMEDTETEYSLPSAFVEIKQAAPDRLQSPYLGQRRSSARARLEIQGTPVKAAKGIMVERGRAVIMTNIEMESMML